MYSIDIRYANDNWSKHDWSVKADDMVDAFLIGKGGIDVAMKGRRYDLLPVGVGEFVIWSKGTCVGFFGIKETDDSTDGV